MQLREIFTTQLRQLMQHIGIQQRQTVENAARQFSITFRDRLRRFPTRSLNFAAHRLRINKAIVIGIDDEAAGRKCLCRGDKRREIVDLPLLKHPLKQP